MKPKVSIIVPIYNVDQYLRRCLESLVNQSFKEIEILCINDGSTDGSQTIVDDYAKCYPNIVKSFVKLNGGLSDARNYGLDCAQGEFIAFVDSDDWIELTMIEEMYKVIIEQSADIAVCDLQYVYDTQRKQYVSGGILKKKVSLVTLTLLRSIIVPGISYISLLYLMMLDFQKDCGTKILDVCQSY